MKREGRRRRGKKRDHRYVWKCLIVTWWLTDGGSMTLPVRQKDQPIPLPPIYSFSRVLLVPKRRLTTVRRKFSNFSFLLLVWLFSWNFFFLFSFLTKSISNVFHPVVGWPTSSREAAWFFQGRETTSFCWPSWSSRCQWIRQKPCRFSWLVTSFSFSSGRFFFLSFFYKSATESRRTSSLPFYCM